MKVQVVKPKPRVHSFFSKKSNKPRHKQCQRAHFKTRYHERFGLSCDQELYQKIKDRVLSNTNYRPDRNHIGREVHIIKWKGGSIKVVYDRTTKQLVTLLGL